ncbi:MAG: hypothetical protein IPM51_07970 [Sphingobacteriaceae bacterium]|nr:hypothetical protein [Sphingobacteriaceae bacterium]
MRLIYWIATYLISTNLMVAQLHTVKPIVKKEKNTNLSIAASFVRSEIFLEQKIKEDSKPPGVSLRLAYSGKKITRLEIEYVHFFPRIIEPKWYAMNLNSLEANCHFTTRFNNTNAMFYPLIGISYYSFSGYFSGKNDSKNVARLYMPGTTILLNMLALNIGTGYEHRIKKIGLFAEYKLRFAGDNWGIKNFGIKDVCIAGGIKYYMHVKSLGTIFKGTRNRYFLNTD